MSSSEDKDLGLKGWLSGETPKIKPQESKSEQVVPTPFDPRFYLQF